MRLLFNGLTKFVCGFLIIALLIFLPAGTINYSDGWTFIILLFFPILIMGIVLFIKSPELLKKRLNGKEKDNAQKRVVALSAFIFLAGFIVAGLDFRFMWTHIPKAIKIISAILFLLSYGIYAEVIRENAYLSRTIEVQHNQKVIDTGLYSLVRHPMYAATILMFLMMPLILGSLISFVIFLGYPIIIAIRIKNEEELLTIELDGYSEYKQKVKYKILPFIW